MGQPPPLFVYFSSFYIQFHRKIVGFSGTRTLIVRVEGEEADHLTTTTAEHSDWLKIVMRLGTAKQSTLFQDSIEIPL